MMRHKRCAKSFVLFVLLVGLSPSSLGVSNVSLSRSGGAIDGLSKYLVFPRGSNVQPETLFTMGVTAGLAYELPHIRTLPYGKPAEVYHRRSRRDLYHKLEIMLTRQGKDGRGCILGALCRAGKRNSMTLADERRPFLHEILHSIFTFPAYAGDSDDEGEESHEHKLRSMEYDRAYNTEDDCDNFLASCPSLF